MNATATELRPPGKIYAAMAAMLKEIEPVKKKKNSQGHKVRGVDDAYNAIHPLLAKHGVFVGCEILSTEHATEQTAKGGTLHFTRLHMRLNFFADDGSSVSSEAYGEAFDSGDKAAGKAMSNAYKYAIFQSFCVPTEDLVDSDTDEPAPTPSASNGNGNGNAQPAKGMHMDATPKPNGDAYEADVNGPIADFQRAAIQELSKKVWGEQWKDQLREVLKMNGVDKLANMTYGKAEKFHAKLEQHLTGVELPY